MRSKREIGRLLPSLLSLSLSLFHSPLGLLYRLVTAKRHIDSICFTFNKVKRILSLLHPWHLVKQRLITFAFLARDTTC